MRIDMIYYRKLSNEIDSGLGGYICKALFRHVII